MNTSLPSEWQPAPPEPPAPLHDSTRPRRRVGTSWRACPLSSSWDEAVARADDRILRSVGRVARQWNSVVRRGLLARLRRRRPTVWFSPEDYALVTHVVPTTTLDRTLTHIALLRGDERSRLGVHAIALLERVETAVAVEVERRRGGSLWGRHLPGEVRGLWAVG
jgi:hypothetical protein